MAKKPLKKGFDSRQTAFLRYMLIVAVLLVWIGGISARLVYLQVNQHEWLKGQAVSKRINVKQIQMPRGTIYDRNERALAVSVKVKTLFADAMEIEDVEKAAVDLARVLNGNKAKIREQLYEAKDLERRYVPLIKGLDEVAAQQVNSALEIDGLRKDELPKYPGLHWREDQKRSYPHQSLAAHIIGFSNAEGVGQAGIEQSQNDVLYGAVIRKVQERDRLGRVYDETVTEKEPPNDVVLTISTSIQHATEIALEKAARASAAKAGMAIVLDHKTGEILALANYPTFDPNKLDGITSENLSNRCIQGVYAPGSVFKLITYSSAFEKQLLTPESQIDAGNGTIEVADHKFSDSHSIGRVDASFAAAACHGAHDWPALDAAYQARTVSPRLRAVSRALGRQLLRSGQRVWPSATLDSLRAASPPDGAHHPLALGAVARAARLDEVEAATCALHHLASTIATSALRLLGLDPFEVYARLADLSSIIDEIAAEAAAAAGRTLDALPATSAPLVEILAEDHATWEVRLFAS